MTGLGRWVTGDAVYGNHRPLRSWLEEQRGSYVLAVSGPEYLRLTMSSFVRSAGQTELVPEQWQRLSAGAGSQGPRWYDWAYLPLEDSATPEGWEHGVLLRRSLTDDEVALYAVFAPLGTTLSRLVEVAGQRWAVECGFQQAKALGLDQYEVRSWEGWHRHMTLVMLAQAALAAMRQQALKKPLAVAAPATASAAAEPEPDTAIPDDSTDPDDPAEVRTSQLTSDRESVSLVPFSMNEIRRWLVQFGQRWQRQLSHLKFLSWSLWRRHHQAVAAFCHQRRRKQRLSANLQL